MPKRGRRAKRRVRVDFINENCTLTRVFAFILYSQNHDRRPDRRNCPWHLCSVLGFGLGKGLQSEAEGVTRLNFLRPFYPFLAPLNVPDTFSCLHCLHELETNAFMAYWADQISHGASPIATKPRNNLTDKDDSIQPMAFIDFLSNKIS